MKHYCTINKILTHKAHYWLEDILFRYKKGKGFFFLYLFIYSFLAVLGPRFVRGLSPVAASGGHSSSRCGDRSSSQCAGPSPSRPLPPRGTGSRRASSAVVAHGPSRSAARGIPPDQGSNPCSLHQQADSQPLRHQGSPGQGIFLNEILKDMESVKYDS